MSNVLPGLKYSKEHEWVKVEGKIATIGITDHAQHALGDIVFVDLPKVGSTAQFMKPAGVVESVKAASDIFSPLTGKITEVNGALTSNPELLNSDPYGKGWISKMEFTNAAELADLMDEKAYAEYLKTL
jgi:glycine cleavage system H protein